MRFEAGACRGDSGGPLVKYITNTARYPYYEQHFIVSSGIGECNLEAQIFVRVADRQVLTWIQKITGRQNDNYYRYLHMQGYLIVDHVV